MYIVTITTGDWVAYIVGMFAFFVFVYEFSNSVFHSMPYMYPAVFGILKVVKVYHCTIVTTSSWARYIYQVIFFFFLTHLIYLLLLSLYSFRNRLELGCSHHWLYFLDYQTTGCGQSSSFLAYTLVATLLVL